MRISLTDIFMNTVVGNKPSGCSAVALCVEKFVVISNAWQECGACLYVIFVGYACRRESSAVGRVQVACPLQRILQGNDYWRIRIRRGSLRLNDGSSAGLLSRDRHRA